MKIKGKKVEGINSEIVPIVRPEGNIFFTVSAITDWSEFDELVPDPIPPEIIRPGGLRERNINDPTYKKAVDRQAELKTAYIIVKSVSATPDLEWELIDLKKPDTWLKHIEEFRLAGLTEFEQVRIIRAAMRVNALDEKMIEEAREAFLQEVSHPAE